MEKNWILTIGIDKYYLTEQEKEFYLTSISKGSKYVAIDENKLLGINFQSLVNKKAIEETEMLEKGKTKCKYGKWHSGSCSCNIEYEIVDGKAIPKEINFLEKI